MMAPFREGTHGQPWQALAEKAALVLGAKKLKEPQHRLQSAGQEAHS